MSQRFQIEDLVAQDHSGVLFRALDTQTQQSVSLRRFFPFGQNGGGLREDEQNAYNATVEKLTHISHPALRRVITGGCDPVDRLPYIASEWIPGTPLHSFIAHRHLQPGEATQMLAHALEICEQVSSALNEEAVWLDTNLKNIIISDEGTGRGTSFWLAPLRSLAKNDQDRSLHSIVRLTEQLMGWEGKSFTSDQGLEGWLTWLRGNVKTATLAEAREKLTNFKSTGPTQPIKTPRPKIVRAPVPAKKSLVRKKKKKVGNPLPGFFITLAAIGICLGSWTMFRKKFPDRFKQEETAPAEIVDAKQKENPLKRTTRSEPAEAEPVAEITNPPVIPPAVSHESPEEKANRMAIDLTAATQKAVAENNAKLEQQKAEIDKTKRTFLTSVRSRTTHHSESPASHRRRHFPSHRFFQLQEDPVSTFCFRQSKRPWENTDQRCA
ncbi:MAG: hypothetical protein HC845_03895 [Akkermansiaceae bacterium]|nr:hypothetical protein [Akkermansiaceae bacterium]